MISLEQILDDELDITILRWLTAVRGRYSGHEIARRTGRQQTSVRNGVSLADQGVTPAQLGHVKCGHDPED